MKKAYMEPEFDVRNYTQFQSEILTLSGGDLNDGDEFPVPVNGAKGIL